MARSGFTLIELLIVVVIVGLLAAIAIPQLSSAKDRAYVATMQSDLRNFSQHEESYFYDNSIYTATMADLTNAGFQPSSMVSITIPEATSSGWSALADHTLSTRQCALFIGSAAPVGGATDEGEVVCQ